jgi:hypothetical protein
MVTADQAFSSCADYTAVAAQPLIAQPRLQTPTTTGNQACHGAYWNFDLSSISGATVTSATIEYDVSTVNGSPSNCEWVGLTTTPPDGFTTYSDIMSGTVFATNDSSCTTTGTGKTVTLNSAGLSALTASAGGDFNIGTTFVDSGQVRDSLEDQVRFTENTATLSLTYSAPPDNTKLLGLNDVTFNVGTDSASVTTLVTGTSTNEVVWDESTATNASFSGNTITGTGGTWGTAAKSIATYSTSDGMYVEMERPSGSYSVMFGFGNGAHTGGTYHFSTLDYGINMGGDVYESNSNVCNSCANLGAGTYKVNIATDGTITYWYKSPTGSYTTPFYTSSTTASGDYSVRVHIHTTYSALAEVTAQGLIPSSIISATGLADNTSTPQHYTFTRSANDWEIYQTVHKLVPL